MFTAAQGGDTFALCAYGLILYDGTEVPRNEAEGLKDLQLASDRGLLWARDLLMCIRGVNAAPDVLRNALISTDAMNQLENYAAQGNLWAKTILAEGRYTGYGMPQDREFAVNALRMAAVKGNLWAVEILKKIESSAQPPMCPCRRSDVILGR